MAGEPRLRNELNKLKAMPYFWLRFISLGIVFALNDLSRVFVSTSALTCLIVLLSVAGIVFAVFECLTLIKLKPKPMFSKSAAILWCIFGLVTVASEIINGHLPLNSLMIFVLLPIFVIMGQEEGFFNMLLFSCGIPIAVNCVLGTVFFPLINNNYALSNAALVPVLLCALAWILLNSEMFYRHLFILFCLLTAVLLYFVGVSGGRTGFLTILATLFFYIIALIIKFYSGKKSILFRNKNINITVILSVALLIALTVSGAVIIDGLVTPPEEIKSIEHISLWEKFRVSITNGNPLSNRGMIWKYTIKNIRLFGNGPDFYNNTDALTPDQCSAHNTYLAVLGHFGIIAFVIFTTFCMYMLLLSIKYCLAHRRLYIFPFTVLISFFVAGITEDLIYMFAPRVFLLLFFAACAYLIIAEGKGGIKEDYTKAKI